LNIAELVLLGLAAYLAGSLPAASLVERIWSVDLRHTGSGNAGAGNATRSAGLKAGVTLALLDGFKGLIPVLLVRWLGVDSAGVVVVGLAAVLGNNWPVFATPRGGRGLATSCGTIVGFAPELILWPSIWSVIGWRIGGGLAGFMGWALLPVYAMLSGAERPVVVLTMGLAVFMVVRRAQGNGGFLPEGTIGRIAFDADPRPTVAPHRPLALGGQTVSMILLLVVGLPTYLWLAGTLGNGRMIERGALWLLAAACVCEFGAKWMFGEVFREGILLSGRQLGRLAAFRAALVGTGVARLIPAGGAITPTAMAWSVGDESPNATGAALRATTLNYGGLAFATGVGLVWITARFPGTAPRTSMLVGLLLVVVGAALVGLSVRLRALIRLAPRRFGSRLDRALVDHRLTGRTWLLLTGRVLLEATTLGFTLVAFGVSIKPSQTVAAFGLSQLVGGLPGTPGGLGTTEAGLLAALAYFGVPAAVGAAPVIAFRLVSYWLPALGGVMAGGTSLIRHRRFVPQR
jgi:glycerol-3-phosphate acyltransferase PlsY